VKRLSTTRGSVVLVALSCVTVLGIATVGFLALSNTSMFLSNRGYAMMVSKHLAEIGLGRAMAAFNDNTFSSWTRPDASTATLSFNIDSARYGSSRITATVNVRVNRYLDTRKCTPWNVLTTYSTGDFVWYQGVWYLCTAGPPANEPPSNTSYWKSAPAPWTPYANYQVGNVVHVGGSGFRCTAANINQPVTNPSFWTAAGITTWTVNTVYGVDNLVTSAGIVYRCIQSHSDKGPPNATYWLAVPVIYAEGVATLADAGATTFRTQLRATLAPASLFPNAVGAFELSNLSAGGTVDSYNSVLGTYNSTSAPFSAASPNIGSSAVVAGAKSSGDAVRISSARINGYVAAPPATTTPFAPRWTFGTSGIVTSTPAPTIPATRRDLARVSRSPFVPRFSIQTVSAVNLLTVPSGTTNLPRGTDVQAADGKYYYYTSTDLYLDTGYTLNITAPVVIDLRPTNSADLSINGSGQIIIANNPTASLEIHLGGQLFVGSNSGGGIRNLTLDPKRCAILSTNTYNSSGYNYFWSNQPYYGVIYMPDGYLHLWNSGYAEQIYGAVAAANVYFNHVANLHYDTSLRTAVISGVDAPFEIAEWRELTDPAERITLP
jgi:hypothetical protein